MSKAPRQWIPSGYREAKASADGELTKRSRNVDNATCEVRFFAAARAAIGKDSVIVPSGQLGSILDNLGTQHPAFAAVAPMCSFLVDGLAIHTARDSITVEPGQCVDVLPPFAGG
jgi:molybdopterin converting factor small subunit